MITFQSVTNEEQFIGTVDVASKFSATDFFRDMISSFMFTISKKFQHCKVLHSSKVAFLDTNNFLNCNEIVGLR